MRIQATLYSIIGSSSSLLYSKTSLNRPNIGHHLMVNLPNIGSFREGVGFGSDTC